MTGPLGEGIQCRKESICDHTLVVEGNNILFCWFFPSSLILGVSQEAQLVKNAPAMQETLVQFLSQEVPLEKG